MDNVKSVGTTKNKNRNKSDIHNPDRFYDQTAYGDKFKNPEEYQKDMVYPELFHDGNAMNKQFKSY